MTRERPIDAAWQERRRLAGALREVVNQLIGVEMTEQELREAADRFAGYARELAGRPHRSLREALDCIERGVDGAALSAVAWRVDFAPHIGSCNPIAAPVRLWQAEAEARGAVRFGAMHEGPPDQVNGGYVAAALDEVLAHAAARSGLAARTARLSVSYREPTPLHRDLELRAALLRVEGRKILTTGSLFDGDRLLADAEGLFVAPREDARPAPSAAIPRRGYRVAGERSGRRMGRIDIAKRYLEALRAADARGASALFREDGVIDDYTGGHHFGRSGIEAFIGGLEAGSVFVSEPERWLEEGDRLTVYARIGLAAEARRELVRWVFHFTGERISHVGISRVDFIVSGRFEGSLPGSRR